MDEYRNREAEDRHNALMRDLDRRQRGELATADVVAWLRKRALSRYGGEGKDKYARNALMMAAKEIESGAVRSPTSGKEST